MLKQLYTLWIHKTLSHAVNYYFLFLSLFHHVSRNVFLYVWMLGWVFAWTTQWGCGVFTFLRCFFIIKSTVFNRYHKSGTTHSNSERCIWKLKSLQLQLESYIFFSKAEFVNSLKNVFIIVCCYWTWSINL